MPETWCAALIHFLKGPLCFLVGNQLTESALQPGTEIKQGDTLSPTIFSLLTAVLIWKVLVEFPQVQSFLFADDTLFVIPGTPGQVRTALESLLLLLQQYGEVSGCWLNMDKCGVVFQGPGAPPPGTILYGVQVRSKVKYPVLGWGT